MSEGYTEQLDRDPQAGRLFPVTEKWEAAIDIGFQLVPDILLKNQVRFGVSATEMVGLLNLTMHWWYLTRHPYLRPATIARRMGLGARMVQCAPGPYEVDDAASIISILRTAHRRYAYRRRAR